MAETDAPYLAPAPLRGSRNEPANVRLVCKKFAEILGKTDEEIYEITTANCKKLFNLAD
jgi:TatD DNase family protein